MWPRSGFSGNDDEEVAFEFTLALAACCCSCSCRHSADLSMPSIWMRTGASGDQFGRRANMNPCFRHQPVCCSCCVAESRTIFVIFHRRSSSRSSSDRRESPVLYPTVRMSQQSISGNIHPQTSGIYKLLFNCRRPRVRECIDINIRNVQPVHIATLLLSQLIASALWSRTFALRVLTCPLEEPADRFPYIQAISTQPRRLRVSACGHKDFES